MLKIGILGLGDIANKAYLPVLCSRELDIHLFTRDTEKLYNIGRQYRISNLHLTLDSIIGSGVKGVFVHTSTESHEYIIEQLLLNNIHVYVDKPITNSYVSAKRLSELAAGRGLILMTGFNRRYAPAYREIKQMPHANMIILQKNRHSVPGDVRTFVFDDFIHVLDTLLFLFDKPVKELIVRGMKEGDKLLHVIVQLIAGNGVVAMGIMNRDSGILEEKLEVFSPEEKRTVINLTESRVNRIKTEILTGINDWESTLSKRGFEAIVSDFLNALETNTQPGISISDSLLTHELCEKVVNQLTVDN